MCELAAKHLVTSDIGSISVTNRTMSKAEALACNVGGDVLPFDKYLDSLMDYDIVISSTGATELLVTKEDVKLAMTGRKKRPMFFYRYSSAEGYRP